MANLKSIQISGNNLKLIYLIYFLKLCLLIEIQLCGEYKAKRVLKNFFLFFQSFFFSSLILEDHILHLFFYFYYKS